MTLPYMVVENPDRACTKWRVGWGFTSQCNMKCSFCYSAGLSRTARVCSSIDRELSFIQRNANRIHSINWGTGENALNDVWFDLISRIHELAPQIVQGVTTNGMLGYRCNRDVHLHEILERCIRDIDVSLDFADQLSHNRFRGNSQAYDWAVNTLELYKYRDSTVHRDDRLCRNTDRKEHRRPVCTCRKVLSKLADQLASTTE